MDRTILTNLVFLFMLTKPDTTFRQLFMGWHKHPVLREYQRPSYEVVRRLWRVSRQVIKEEYVRH